MIYRILLFPIYLIIGCLGIFACGTYEMFNLPITFFKKQ
jgi:hypothetical protein